jgi:hypothetical protein
MVLPQVIEIGAKNLESHIPKYDRDENSFNDQGPFAEHDVYLTNRWGEDPAGRGCLRVENRSGCAAALRQNADARRTRSLPMDPSPHADEQKAKKGQHHPERPSAGAGLAEFPSQVSSLENWIIGEQSHDPTDGNEQRSEKEGGGGVAGHGNREGA